MKLWISSGRGTNTGISVTTACVVSSIPATLHAFSTADLVTLAGSTIPWAIRSQYSPVSASKPQFSSELFTLSIITSLGYPAFLAITLSGAVRASLTILTPKASSPDKEFCRSSKVD